LAAPETPMAAMIERDGLYWTPPK